jgi:hypothetical protein
MGLWRPSFGLWLGAALATAGSYPTFAQVTAVRPKPPDDATPQIVGGKQVDTTDYPATWGFTAGRQGCTATAVGPQTILTAAHCLVDTTLGSVADGKDIINVACASYPGWVGQYPQVISTYDVALCLASAQLPLAQDRPYERVSLTPKEIAPKTRVTLLGWGCTGAATKDDLLYAGTAVTAIQDLGAYLTTGTGGAQFCPGDSGGAVYHELDSYRRAIAGVASRGNGITSYITQISTSDVAKFFNDWATSTTILGEGDHAICGINAPADMCHG